MHGINDALEFVPVRIAIVTISDTRTLDTDTSGQSLEAMVGEAGHKVARRDIVPDDEDAIQRLLRTHIDDPEVDVVISTGGTGLTGRDVTPEAAIPLFDKVLDGFSVVFHQVSYESVGLSTLQSRACAGVASGTFIFCLPGSRGAVRDGWEKVIRLQLDSRHKPCNLVEIMPRLMER